MYLIFVDGHIMIDEVTVFSELGDTVLGDTVQECTRLANEQIGHTFEVYFLQKIGSARTEPAQFVRVDSIDP